MKRHHECARILIKAGADVNARDEKHVGDTALAFAVENRDLAMTQLLCAAGADPRIEGNMADTPFEKAARMPEEEGVHILRVLQGNPTRQP
jgi:ankyrin repeat protein